MSQLTLTYFDFNGGRGEPARLALCLGGISFEDKRFAFPEFAEVRKSTPFGQVPTLHVDGVQITQSDAITRYVGKLAGLYPTDTYQALLCDEVLGAVEDITIKLAATFGLTGDALKDARTAFVAGPLTVYLRWLQSQLQAHGGQYFADNRLTVADLKVFGYVRGLGSGNLDHVPTDVVEQVAPLLNAHMRRVGETPAIAQYYARLAG
ncbi:glutathione S-transferase [Rhodoferax lacus]|uniref:Glutathione S-transferase n=1 Tax=Rhodoferax lacus TaxID=2184758 RepID=A0A3E1R5T8_9BURK|nr:glutathione S-transferase family protein [Rhodoferax lacus]RFO94745.1 glutathione S-transferase [Rhodoferax lacus]